MIKLIAVYTGEEFQPSAIIDWRTCRSTKAAQSAVEYLRKHHGGDILAIAFYDGRGGSAVTSIDGFRAELKSESATPADDRFRGLVYIGWNEKGCEEMGQWDTFNSPAECRSVIDFYKKQAMFNPDRESLAVHVLSMTKDRILSRQSVPVNQ